MNKLKWYDWIPIIGLISVVNRDSKFPSNITMLIWFIYQLTIVETVWIKFMLYE